MATDATPTVPTVTYAHLVEGTVREVVELPGGLVPGEDVFTPAFAAELVPCGADVGQGWTTADGGKTFAAPPAIAVPPTIRTATSYQLMSALTDDQRAAYGTAVKPWDQRLFAARDTPWPEGNIKIGRIADALKTSPAAWFDAALKPAG